VLERLVAGIEQVLGGELVGVYLQGSLAYGGFEPERSDIDFVAVLRDRLTDEQSKALEQMHHALAEGGYGWARDLEGAYLPASFVRRHDPHDEWHQEWHDGEWKLGGFGQDWDIPRWILRERGVALTGPDPRQLVDPVSADQLRAAVRSVLKNWWQPMLTDGGFLRQGAGYQGFAVMTMCRALHTLATGQVSSKGEAVAWALENLPEEWHDLIRAAGAWRRGVAWDRLEEVLGLIRYTLEKA
jgi:hypothetical protein